MPPTKQLQEAGNSPDRPAESVPGHEVREAAMRGLLDRLARRQSVLDVGARDGHFSKILLSYYPEVTALDLEKPRWEHSGITTVAGDATKLAYANNSFDVVFCTEVLEHVPQLEKACRELVRVARYEIIVSVPYKQDTRIYRTTCRNCGKPNPPYGHVNSFDETRLRSLFDGADIVDQILIGESRYATNPLSTLLMGLAGNPWGAYHQEEPCIYCGAKLVRPPEPRPLLSRMSSAIALRMDKLQEKFTATHANWICLVFSKKRTPRT